MKKVLYGIFVIFAFAAIFAWVVFVQVGEAVGSVVTSVSAGSFFAISVSIVSSAVGVAFAVIGGGDGFNIGIIIITIISIQ